jgi:integrase
MTKHYKEVTLKSGRIVFGFNPSATLQDKLGYHWEQYNTAVEAKARCEEAIAAFAEFKRTGALPSIALPRTVADLISAYKGTSRWRKITKVPNSQRAYEQALSTAVDLIGDISISEITPTQAEALYDRLCNAGSINKANTVMKMLGIVWSNGERLELVRSNPFSGISLEATPDRDVMWTAAQIQTFVATADANGLGSIGTIALLAYELCQRPGDCRQMLWGHYKDNVFSFTQEKTGTEMRIPSTITLTQRLDMIPSNRNPNDAIALYEGTGRPYTDRLYRKKAQFVRELAGLPDHLKVSDLRRTGATLLGQSSTEDQIRAVTGHKSRQILNTYVRPNLSMAEAAQTKRQNYDQHQQQKGNI